MLWVFFAFFFFSPLKGIKNILCKFLGLLIAWKHGYLPSHSKPYSELFLGIWALESPAEGPSRGSGITLTHVGVLCV